MEIAQDGQRIMNIAALARDIAQEFMNGVEGIYNLLDNDLGGPGDTSKKWYGPRAQKFKMDAERKKDIYNQMRQALDNLANTIEKQAISWANHESV